MIPMLTDEMIMHIGLGVAGLSIIFAVICVCVFMIKKKRLNNKFDEEYGNAYNSTIKG